MNNIKLQANLCKCSGVWFNEDLPESEPSFCPFCNLKLSKPHLKGIDEITDEITPNYDIGKIPSEGVVDLDKLKLTMKVCRFCSNEIYVGEECEQDAYFCPYCDDYLFGVGSSNLKQGNPNDAQGHDSTIHMGLDMNDLTDTRVMVLFKSLNPWNKPVEAIWGGVDVMSMRVKLLTDTGIFWYALANIISVQELTDDDKGETPNS